MATILLVDDETALARVLKEALALQLAGAVVHSASTWAEALDVAGELDRLDLLIADHHLGAQTGIDLCVALRERFPGLPTLIYTGKATSDVEAAAASVGARVLWKPQRLHRLLEEVRSMMP